MSRTPPPLPVQLELAPLPRTQVGAFLILGADKDADRDTIEACWAQRLIWARKNLTKTPLEDINWAREMLSDMERRIRADAASLNIDTTDGVLKAMRQRFGGKDSAAARPMDVEKDLSTYEPPVVVPDSNEVRGLIPQPEVPREVPAVQVILDDFIAPPLDPWCVDLE